MVFSTVFMYLRSMIFSKPEEILIILTTCPAGLLGFLCAAGLCALCGIWLQRGLRSVTLEVMPALHIRATILYVSLNA